MRTVACRIVVAALYGGCGSAVIIEADGAHGGGGSTPSTSTVAGGGEGGSPGTGGFGAGGNSERACWEPVGTASAALWSQRYGGAGANRGTHLAVDSNQNVVIVVRMSGTIDFGNGLIDPKVPSGMQVIVIAKIAPAGNVIWTKALGSGAISQWPLSLRLDEADNIWLAGTFEGLVDFDGTVLSNAPMERDGFVVKLDTNGDHVWSLAVSGPGWERPEALPDGVGGVFVTVTSDAAIDLGGGQLIPAGIDDIVLARFDNNGAHTWSKIFGGPNAEWVRALGVAANGDLVIVGNFEGALDLGGGPLMGSSGKQSYAARVTASGTHVWSSHYDDAFMFGTVGAAENILLSGYFSGSLDFGGGAMVSAGTDVFVTMLDPAGAHVWSHRFGDADFQYGHTVAGDVDGNVVVAGLFRGAIDFGGAPLSVLGSSDIFVAKLDSLGNHMWSARSGDESVVGSQQADAVTTDAAGNVYVTGQFTGTICFGNAPLTSAADYDTYLAKLPP